MIKINLLPIRAARKRESVKQQLVLFAVLLIGTAVGLFLWYNAMAKQIDDKNNQIKTTKQQIEQYKKAIGEVEKYKGLEENLARKLKIIENLIKGKTGPVRVLDRLSQIIPKQVWLVKWTEKGGGVTIEGEAINNKHVAQFITVLKDSSGKSKNAKKASKPGKPGSVGKQAKKENHRNFFSDVRLVEVASTKDGKFVEFKIIMKVNYSI